MGFFGLKKSKREKEANKLSDSPISPQSPLSDTHSDSSFVKTDERRKEDQSIDETTELDTYDDETERRASRVEDFENDEIRELVFALKLADMNKITELLNINSDFYLTVMPMVNNRSLMHLVFQYGILETDKGVDIRPLVVMLSWIKNLINKDANNTEKEESYKRMFMFGDNNGAIPLHYVAHHSNIVAILDKIFYEADEVFFSCEELCERLKTLNLTSNVLLKEWIEQKENKKMIGKAITSCALVGRLEYVQFFESLGVDLNIHNDQDETPLHAAAAGGQIEVADYLLNSGVNVNYSHFSNQSQNWTPLFEAVLHDKRPIVELLLSSRAEYSKRCKKKSRFGLSQLNMNDVAAASGNVSLLQLFVKMGVPIEKTAIYWGCYGGNVSIIMFLLEKGLLLRERNLYDFSKTTLHASCERGCTIATEFIASKAPRLVNVADKNGNTPLHYCAFISAPPSKRAANATGVKYSHSENVVQTLIDSLIRNGADITIKNNDGKLALDLFESTSLATFLEDKYDATFNTQRQLLFEVKELQDRLAKLEDLVIKQNTTIQNQAATIEDMKNNMVVAPPVSPPKLYKQVKFADNIAQIVEYEVLESESSSEDGDPPDVDDDEDEDY